LNVIELGCGCGIDGIFLAQSIPDCDVLLTDLPEVDELVEKNIKLARPHISSRIRFAALDWEAPLPPAVQSKAFDVIVAAECIYNTDSIPPLVDTLARLIKRSPRAIIIVATKVRHSSESMFYDLCTKRGLVQGGKISLPLPGQPGHGYGDSSTSVDLYTYHGKDYRQTYSPDEMERVFDLRAD
jgi:ubiquinone/menaquinone biosynthesis C-methylase UbiE